MTTHTLPEGGHSGKWLKSEDKGSIMRIFTNEIEFFLKISLQIQNKYYWKYITNRNPLRIDLYLGYLQKIDEEVTRPGVQYFGQWLKSIMNIYTNYVKKSVTNTLTNGSQILQKYITISTWNMLDFKILWKRLKSSVIMLKTLTNLIIYDDGDLNDHIDDTCSDITMLKTLTILIDHYNND